MNAERKLVRLRA